MAQAGSMGYAAMRNGSANETTETMAEPSVARPLGDCGAVGCGGGGVHASAWGVAVEAEAYHGGIGTAAFSIPGESDGVRVRGLEGRDQAGNDNQAGWLRAYRHALGGWTGSAGARREAKADALSAALWVLQPVMSYVPTGMAEAARDVSGSAASQPIVPTRAVEQMVNAEVVSTDCYADILARYEWDVTTMKAIFWRESNCQLDPPHYNLSRSICQAYGPVWQWLLDQYDWSHSPEQAIEMCHIIFQRAGGYSPWAQ